MAAPGAVILNPDVAQKDPREALVVAVTARATFDLEAEHRLFLARGPEEYTEYQRAHATEPLPPGTAFPFIQAVQLVNQRLLERDPRERGLLDVMVLSNNSPEAGRRIVHCARQAGLEISKFCFVSAEDSTQYLREHNVGLFLSTDRTDVCNALKRGEPFPHPHPQVCPLPEAPGRAPPSVPSFLWQETSAGPGGGGGGPGGGGGEEGAQTGAPRRASVGILGSKSRAFPRLMATCTY
ncbi:cytosolic 5'-nucleotidase 1A-like [Sarcophilus harrisii]|uniref:cytosolic 5'-nucleotidase 1A-like n=1 Tax=Sarcophilus harrisii TaxID=9305 RepID=UPI001301C388|nr:cytosolic 5'-nucleotidase 1A-like [Sarcophilus harrisii]